MAGQKLYRAETTLVLYVMADDASGAHMQAELCVYEALNDQAETIFDITPAAESGIDENWEGSLPYNGDGETTVNEYLEQEANP